MQYILLISMINLGHISISADQNWRLFETILNMVIIIGFMPNFLLISKEIFC